MQWKHMLWPPPLLSTKLLKDTKQKLMRKEEEEFRGNEGTNERARELFCGKWKWNVLGRRI
jgi:hypothetical protein